MLEIGNGGMSDTEYRTHFSLWALLAAPLLAGNDLRTASQATLALLTNSDVIAVDQDPLGREGTRVSQSGDTEVWSKPLSGGRTAIGLFNRADNEAQMTVRWSDLGLPSQVRVRDLWAHTDMGTVADHFSTQVPSHGVTLIRVEP
jgi:alpha-galactosidase